MEFTNVHNRKNTKSVKWDMLKTVFGTNEVLPMWVADMDFPAPQIVNEKIIERAKHGIYGYTLVDHTIETAILNWQSKRHNWDIKGEWLSYTPTVITSLHAAIQALTQENDGILIQTPVYTPFFNVIEQHKRKIIKNPLVLKDGRYEIDFVDFEEKIKQGVKAFILCSPHNPVGRVWSEAELWEMARICLKYNVLIIADEIHGDLVYKGYKHIPIASLLEEIAEQTITCTSPTKTFNLAGLQVSYMITPNESIRSKVNKYLELQGINMLNTIGIIALEAAYTHGEPWLDELLNTLSNNQDYLIESIEQSTDQLKVIRSEGTYLNWIDCKGLGMDDDELNKFMINEAKVGLNRGIIYGQEGSQFMRINIACPLPTLKSGVKRIIEAINGQ